MVSRTHAEVVASEGGYVVRDLGSANGTYLNGVIVDGATVKNGDTITVGDHKLRAEIGHGQDGDASSDSNVVLFSTAPVQVPPLRLQGQPATLQQSLLSKDLDRARRARLRLDALLGITHRLASLRVEEEIYPLVVDELMLVLPAERAVVLRRGEDAAWQTKVARNAADPGRPVEVSRTILDEVAAENMCVLSADAMFDERIDVSDSIMLHNIRAVLCVPIEYNGELLGALYLDAPGQEGLFTEEDLHFVSGVAGVAAVAINNAVVLDQVRAAARELNRSYLAMLAVLANAIEARDHYTIGHTWRVARFSQAIARELGWPEERLSEVEVGGLLHDIGKIGVPDSILTKTGPLTDDEQEQMELHPHIGARMLQDVPSLTNVLPYVLYHHEQYDGSGYPYQLEGEAIPIEARLLAVADALDAMTSDRPYRRGLDRDLAITEIRRRAGSQFDPEVVDALIKAYREGKLDPFLQAGMHDTVDVICPRCSTSCSPSPSAVRSGEVVCPTCNRHLVLHREGEHVHAELG
jgi:putative nucleotidyltransferase with HDIG domain